MSMQRALQAHVDSGEVGGLAWGIAHRGEVRLGTAGVAVDGGAAVAEDTIFRISSTSKPITAVAALLLVEDGRLALDDAVDDLLPELADRRVLVHAEGPLDEVGRAARAITLRDLLTFRMGIGMDFDFSRPQPVLDAMGALGLGAGPPAPAGPPGPDEWIRRLGTLPLSYQPGERWLYHVPADVLGVLIARASGQSFESFLEERLFEPLGMTDTAFFVPAAERARFGACYATDPTTGVRVEYDGPDGQWAQPPAFAGGGAGLVSTVGDLLAFGALLQAGGRAGGTELLSAARIAEMTTNHLSDAQLAASSPDPSGAMGWGFGVGVRLRASGGQAAGTYGWDGGLGSAFANDPHAQLTGVLLTTQMWTSPTPPPVCETFWREAYAA